MIQRLRLMLLAVSLLVFCGVAHAELVGTNEAAASVEPRPLWRTPSTEVTSRMKTRCTCSGGFSGVLSAGWSCACCAAQASTCHGRSASASQAGIFMAMAFLIRN